MFLGFNNCSIRNLNATDSVSFKGNRATSRANKVNVSSDTFEVGKTRKPSKALQKLIDKAKQEMEAKVGKKYSELTPEDFLKFFRAEVQRDPKDGLLKVSHLVLPAGDISGVLMQDPDFPLQKILAAVKEVKGDVSIHDSKYLKDLGGIQRIGGRLFLVNCSQFESLNGLRSVGGRVELENLPLFNNFGKMKTVGGDFFMYKCPSVRSSGALRQVKGLVEIWDCSSLRSFECKHSTAVFKKIGPMLKNAFRR